MTAISDFILCSYNLSQTNSNFPIKKKKKKDWTGSDKLNSPGPLTAAREFAIGFKLVHWKLIVYSLVKVNIGENE